MVSYFPRIKIIWCDAAGLSWLHAWAVNTRYVIIEACICDPWLINEQHGSLINREMVQWRKFSFINGKFCQWSMKEWFVVQWRNDSMLNEESSLIDPATAIPVPSFFPNLGDAGCVCYKPTQSWPSCYPNSIVFLVVWLLGYIFIG